MSKIEEKRNTGQSDEVWKVRDGRSSVMGGGARKTKRNNETRVQRMSREESRYAKLNLGANNTP